MRARIGGGDERERDSAGSPCARPASLLSFLLFLFLFSLPFSPSLSSALKPSSSSSSSSFNPRSNSKWSDGAASGTRDPPRRCRLPTVRLPLPPFSLSLLSLPSLSLPSLSLRLLSARSARCPLSGAESAIAPWIRARAAWTLCARGRATLSWLFSVTDGLSLRVRSIGASGACICAISAWSRPLSAARSLACSPSSFALPRPSCASFKVQTLPPS